MLFYFIIGAQLLYNVMLVSTLQQNKQDWVRPKQHHHVGSLVACIFPLSLNVSVLSVCHRSGLHCHRERACVLGDKIKMRIFWYLFSAGLSLHPVSEFRPVSQDAQGPLAP